MVSFPSAVKSSHIPHELIVTILKDDLSSMYMLNKELTEIYLKKKYSEICLPHNVLAFKNGKSLYPYASYVKSIHVCLSKLIPNCRRFDYDVFINATTLTILDGHDKHHQYQRIIRQLPKLQHIKTVPNVGLTLDCIVFRLNAASNLRSMSIPYLNVQLKCINELPSLTKLEIHRATNMDIIQLYAGKEYPVFKHISHLIAHDYQQCHTDALSTLFPNCNKLEITQEYRNITNEIRYRFQGLPLTNLTCQGSFEIPLTVRNLECINYDLHMEIPSPERTFDKVRFYIILGDGHYDSEHIYFERCMEYCRNATFPVVVSFNDVLICSNTFEPPFNKFYHTETDGLHVFCKAFRECLCGEETYFCSFIMGFMGDFLRTKTDWGMHVW